MTEFNKSYKKIISDLENGIKDPKDLALAKEKITELIVSVFDTIDTLSQLEERQFELEKKVKKMHKSLKRIEEDIYEYDDDCECDGECSGDCDGDCEGSCDCGHCKDEMHDNDYEFEIECPYCNYEFVVGQDEDLKDEIECPNCHKIIELDWDDCVECDCLHCDGNCSDEDLAESIKEEEENYIVENDDKKKNENNTQNEDDM